MVDTNADIGSIHDRRMPERAKRRQAICIHRRSFTFHAMTREQKAHQRLFKRRKLSPLPPAQSSIQPEPIAAIEDQPWVRPYLELPTAARVITVNDQHGRIGQATWWKRSAGWICIGAQKHVAWMLNLSINRIRREITKRGLTFTWASAPISFPNP